VTRDAVDRLGLLPGQAVQALIKSVSFDHAR
jgi:ABC-type molybdate transport system ATPase subunit